MNPRHDILIITVLKSIAEILHFYYTIPFFFPSVNEE